MIAGHEIARHNNEGHEIREQQEILLDCDQSNVLLAHHFLLYSFKSFFVPFGLY